MKAPKVEKGKNKEKESPEILDSSMPAKKQKGVSKLDALKAQEAWFKEQEKLEKLCRKMLRKLGKPGADSDGLREKLTQLQARLQQMKAEEVAAAVKATPAKPLLVFTNKSTPTSGIAKTAFDATENLRRAERNLRFSELLPGTGDSQVSLQEVRLALAAGLEDSEGEDRCVAFELAVFGTSTALEKPYLRLTSAPPLDSVRPPAVLKQALDLAKKKWRRAAETNSELQAQREAYSAFCEQLKVLS